MRELRDAIETEFADDPTRLQTARRLVEQAAEKGPSGVAAVAQLDKMVEAKRSGRATPTREANAAAVEAEIVATIEHIIELDLLRAFAAVEARAGEVGWELAVAEYRGEHADAAEFVRKQGRVWMGAERGWEQGPGDDWVNRQAAERVFGGEAGR